MKQMILAAILALVAACQPAIAERHDLGWSDAAFVEKNFLGVWQAYHDAGTLRIDMQDGVITIMFDDTEVMGPKIVDIDRDRLSITLTGTSMATPTTLLTLRKDEHGQLWFVTDVASFPSTFTRRITSIDRAFFDNVRNPEPRGPEERGCGLFGQFC